MTLNTTTATASIVHKREVNIAMVGQVNSSETDIRNLLSLTVTQEAE